MAEGDPAAKQPMTQALCGKKVAVGIGAITVGLSKTASAQCTKAAIELKNYLSVSAAVLGLSVGRVATAARARSVVLTHLLPGDQEQVAPEQWRERVASTYRGPVTVGEDLMRISVGGHVR